MKDNEDDARKKIAEQNNVDNTGENYDADNDNGDEHVHLGDDHIVPILGFESQQKKTENDGVCQGQNPDPMPFLIKVPRKKNAC